MNHLQTLRQRLKRIEIEIELLGNIPWIYLYSVNGNPILKKDWNDNHGFTVAYYNWEIELTDTKRIFEVIRKYK
jgi:hypothetical protein